MKPQRPARLLVPVVAVPLLAAAAFVQPQDMSDVELKLEHVNGEVHVLYGAGGNIAFQVGEDGALMVDDQFAPLAERIDAELDKLTESPLRFLVNTHWHGDHTGGNVHFGAEATIVAHTNVRRRLSGDTSLGGRISDPPTAKVGLPSVTHENGLSLHVNGEEVELMHFGRGHTDGDTVVWFKRSNVVHTGDLLFHGRFPYFDIDSGGDPRDYLKAQERLLAELPPDVLVIPGHGEVTDLGGLRAAHALLGDCLKLVEEALARGEDAATMKANRLLEAHADAAWGFIDEDRFIDLLTAALSR